MTFLKDKVLRARMRLMLLHPYLSSCVTRLPLIEVPRESWCMTAATDGYFVYWNPVFFESLDEDEVMGVLAHELLHVVLAHLERRGLREERAWNIAVDHAVNLYLLQQGIKLPESRLADRRYSNLTAEEIYARLNAERFSKASSASSEGGLIRIGKRKTSGKNNAASGQNQETGDGFDIHVQPDDPRVAVYQRDRISPDELKRLSTELQIDLQREMDHGKFPADFVEAFRFSSRSRVPWQVLLARCFSGIRRDDYRFLPPSKKHMWRGIYLPSVGVPGAQTIVCAIDTSGSIQGKIAEQFLTEVSKLRMSAKCKLYVVQCDAKIQKTDSYESWETPSKFDEFGKLLGRGGTDFRPVFDWVKTVVVPRDGMPDFVVYLTDGYGTFPENWNICPVVWVVAGDNTKFPFGTVISMDDAGS